MRLSVAGKRAGAVDAESIGEHRARSQARSGAADLSRVETVVRELGDSNEHAIVMKSTVPVGTGRSIRRRRDGVGYVSNPEFLQEGSAVEDFMHPNRVVIGSEDGSDGFADR